MKINAVKTMIVVSLLIIILYTLGLFLPIIKNTKNSKNIFPYKMENINKIWKSNYEKKRILHRRITNAYIWKNEGFKKSKILYCWIHFIDGFSSVIYVLCA